MRKELRTYRFLNQPLGPLGPASLRRLDTELFGALGREETFRYLGILASNTSNLTSVLSFSPLTWRVDSVEFCRSQAHPRPCVPAEAPLPEPGFGPGLEEPLVPGAKLAVAGEVPRSSFGENRGVFKSCGSTCWRSLLKGANKKLLARK